MSTRLIDMTRGKPLRLLVSFSIPMLIGNLFQQVYNMADSMIVGKLVSADALGAIGTTGSITFLFFAICNGISSGGGIITSQAFGHGDEETVKKCIVNTGLVMLILPTFIGILSFFLAPWILSLLDTPDKIQEDAFVYLRTMCIGILFVSVYNYAASMLRALGDSKTPLYFLMFSCLLNVGLDLLFILGFNAGVFGAGLATIISQFVSAVLCLAFALKKNPYFKIDKVHLHADWNLIHRILKLGVPLSMQFSLIAISCMALQKTVNSFEETAVTVFTTVSRIEQIIQQPYQTLSAALSTFCGQNWGAGEKKRVEQGFKTGMIIMVVFTLIMIPVIQLFGGVLVSLFVKAEETNVISMGQKALRISSLFYLFLGVIYVVRGVLNGLGDASFALLNGIVEVIGRFFVPLLLCFTLGIGVWGIWWSVGVVWFMSGASAVVRYIVYRRSIWNKALVL